MRWLLVFVLVGCASPVVSRGPASDLDPASLNETEKEACDGVDCREFIAPCSMREHSPANVDPTSPAPPRYLTQKEEAYLREFDNYARNGYCQLPPRVLRAEDYNGDTCLYVFRRDRLVEATESETVRPCGDLK